MVTALTWRPLAWPRSTVREDGVWVVEVPSLVDWERDHRPLVAALNTAFSIATGVAGALMIRRRWDSAYAAGIHPEGTVAAIAAGRRRSFVVNTWLVGPLGNADRLRRSPARGVVLRLLAGAYCFVPQTPDSADELASLGIPRTRITIVETGVDLHHFRPVKPARDARGPSDATLAVFAGRFDLRHKRLDLLVDAWKAASLENSALVLAGTGHDEAAVRRMADSKTRIDVRDWQADVRALLGAADFFVLPTVAEVRPKAMLEAMACGLPCIASATSGLVGLELDGVFLAENSLAAWVEALRAMHALGDDGRRAAGRRARAWVEAHADSDRELAQMADLLSDARVNPHVRPDVLAQPQRRRGRGRGRRPGLMGRRQ
jgi:glycosyltransferase involved in cell wall biosynthesis